MQDFLDQLHTDNQSDYDQIWALLLWTASNGPPKNPKKSRPLEGEILELKTRRGMRIPYFYDEGQVVICTEAMRKPRKSELRAVITRARATREQYFRAKHDGCVEILQEDA